MKLLELIHKRFIKYIYDQSINVKDRSFILYSVLVLVALFFAVPCGLIMHEPLSATISTLMGAICFSIYLFYSFKKRRIERAKMVLSLVVVFVFLPAMFFTNGGANSGTPVWLLLGMVYITLIMEYTREGNFFDSVIAIYSALLQI